MHLSFLRHGKAENHAVSDEKRKLTEKGVRQINRLSSFLKNNNFIFDAIISSPYLRALQTAEIIGENLSCRDIIFTENELSCGAGITNIKSIVRQYKDSSDFLFVGHAPDLSYIAQDLLGCSHEVHFKTASFVTMESQFVRSGSASLEFFIRELS